MNVTENILQSFTLAIPHKIIYQLIICKPKNNLNMGLLNVNLHYILVLWENGIKNPPTISVGGYFVYELIFTLP